MMTRKTVEYGASGEEAAKPGPEAGSTPARSTRKEIAALRMKAASEHVENAQHELERAISALGAVQWMSGEQAKLGVLRDRIHEAWYRLAPISHVRAKACAKATLDREVEPGDEAPHRGCCPGHAVLVRGERVASPKQIDELNELLDGALGGEKPR